MPNFRAIRRNIEAKAFALSYGSGSSGRTPSIPVGRYDYPRVLGDLATSSIVSLALGWLGRNVIQGRIVVGTEDDGEYDEVARHPLTLLLRRPNPLHSWEAILQGTCDALTVDGNAYWIKARNRRDGGVEEIYWAPNYAVTIDEETDPYRSRTNGPIRRYGYSNGALLTWYDPKDIVHFRDGIDPYVPYMGLSRLKAQTRNIGSVAFAERYTGAVLRNAHAGKILAPKDSSAYAPMGSPDEREMAGVKAQVERDASSENAGRLIHSSLAVEMIDIGMGPEDMALATIVDRPESYVLAAVGVNALVLNLSAGLQGSTFSNKAEAVRDAWNNGVIPKQDLIASGIEHHLLPDFEANADGYCVWWDRSDVQALKEDANERATRAQLLYTGDVAKRNEAREIVDLPPDEEGGDAYASDVAAEQAQAAADQQAEAAQQLAEAQPEPEPAMNGNGNGQANGNGRFTMKADEEHAEGESDA